MVKAIIIKEQRRNGSKSQTETVVTEYSQGCSKRWAKGAYTPGSIPKRAQK
jgi:hypothetical protein